jgi:hypothetical protein
VCRLPAVEMFQRETGFAGIGRVYISISVRTEYTTISLSCKGWNPTVFAWPVGAFPTPLLAVSSPLALPSLLGNSWATVEFRAELGSSPIRITAPLCL